MRVILTRAPAQAQAWLAPLQAAGWEVLQAPLIAIAPVADSAPLHRAWRELARYSAVMFVSANAVDGFFAAKPSDVALANFFGSGNSDSSTNSNSNSNSNSNNDNDNDNDNDSDSDSDSPDVPRAYATGAGTTAALLRWGVAPSAIDAPHLQPPAGDQAQWDSEALWALVGSQINASSRILVVRGTDSFGSASQPSPPQGVGRDWWGEQVQRAGGQVEWVVAYQRCLPTLDEPTLAALCAAADAGASLEAKSAPEVVWLFSSSQALHNLRRLLPQHSFANSYAVVTHPRIAQVARAMGFGQVYESAPRMDSVLASLESLL